MAGALLMHFSYKLLEFVCLWCHSTVSLGHYLGIWDLVFAHVSGVVYADIRKRFFTQMVVGHWNSLSREAVTAPSLLNFQEHLDNALRLVV